jgi:Ca2+/Na+ antiporter
MEPSTAQLVIRGVGLVSAMCALLGGILSVWTLVLVLRGKFDDVTTDDTSSFRKFFFLFFGISIAFNLLLGWIGARLLFGQPMPWWLFLAVFLLPVFHILVVGRLWRNPQLGLSVGAATGIGNAGLVVPFFCFLPIWGPVALWVAS